MNIVVHMTPCASNSTIASARVARFIVETLAEDRFNLVDTKEKAKSLLISGCNIQNLIIVNGPMAFCDFLDELALLVYDARRVIWVQQDYTINPPNASSKAESPFRKAFADRKLLPNFWTTVKKNVFNSYCHYINWNQLTYDPQPLRPLAEQPTLLYYGAYRQKREKDFIKYFHNAPYAVHVSTTTLRGKKFAVACGGVQVVPPFVGVGNMPPCSASLYIEDEKSHKEFHSPANRFYELLSATVPMLFDIGTLPMLAEAGIIPKLEWVVESQKDVSTKLQDKEFLENMRIQQRECWHMDYVSALRNRLLEVWQTTKGA